MVWRPHKTSCRSQILDAIVVGVGISSQRKQDVNFLRQTPVFRRWLLTRVRYVKNGHTYSHPLTLPTVYGRSILSSIFCRTGIL